MNKNKAYILIVEDDELHIQFVIQSLVVSLPNYEIVSAKTLVEARKQIENGYPAIALVDWCLPDGKGIELVNEYACKTLFPIIIMTNYENRERIIEAIKAGAMDYLIKSQELYEDMPLILARIFNEWENILNRKNFEENLKNSEAKLRALLEQSIDAIIIYNSQARIVEWNKAAEQIMFINKNEVLGQYIWDIEFQLITPEHQNIQYYESLKKTHLKILSEKNIANNLIEGEIHCRDGSRKYVQISIFPLNIDNEFLCGRIIRDFTNTKKHELEILKAKQKAEESDRLKTTFLNTISHEIRTPLNAIIGFSDLLCLSGTDSDKISNYSQIIQQKSYELLEILSEVIDVSKIESGQIKIKDEIVTLTTLFSELKDKFEEKQKQENKLNIKIRFTHPVLPKPLKIIADFERLSQILQNLIENALKFTSEGSIDINYKYIDSKLTFSVKDTGIGISKEKIPVIFERFRQADEGNSRAYGGAGLGLAIVKGLIELMNGTLEVESEVNKGSVFSFTIPCKPYGDAAAQVISSEDLNWGGKKILIAEDDFISYLFLYELLSPTNAEIFHASDGLQAINMAQREKFDVILMDVQMPEVNGIEATETIRKFNKITPIVIQSAFATEKDKERYIDSGCNSFIAKPLEHNLLLTMLVNYIGS